jgi:hypothetical protein
MRIKRLLVGLVVASVSLAMPAMAKEGVRAKLDKPFSLDAAPGKTVRVAWRLVDEEGSSFGASGIYLRVSRCGRSPLKIRATKRGRARYSARFKVPKGGIRKLTVGLKAWRIVGERRERADASFQFDPPLVRRCP